MCHINKETPHDTGMPSLCATQAYGYNEMYNQKGAFMVGEKCSPMLGTLWGFLGFYGRMSMVSTWHICRQQPLSRKHRPFCDCLFHDSFFYVNVLTLTIESVLFHVVQCGYTLWPVWKSSHENEGSYTAQPTLIVSSTMINGCVLLWTQKLPELTGKYELKSQTYSLINVLKRSVARAWFVLLSRKKTIGSV